MFRFADDRVTVPRQLELSSKAFFVHKLGQRSVGRKKRHRGLLSLRVTVFRACAAYTFEHTRILCVTGIKEDKVRLFLFFF